MIRLKKHTASVDNSQGHSLDIRQLGRKWSEQDLESKDLHSVAGMIRGNGDKGSGKLWKEPAMRAVRKKLRKAGSNPSFSDREIVLISITKANLRRTITLDTVNYFTAMIVFTSIFLSVGKIDAGVAGLIAVLALAVIGYRVLIMFDGDTREIYAAVMEDRLKRHDEKGHDGTSDTECECF